MSFSIIGLGKVGSCIAKAIANMGINVIGVDNDPDVVNAMNKERISFQGPETNLHKHFCATVDYQKAVLESEISYIFVPTPSDSRGRLLLDSLESACANIGKALAYKDGYHVISIGSTVLPGSIRNKLVAILEKMSGKKCGKEFGLCYNPVFIALGSIVENFLNPDFILIGEYAEEEGRILESYLKKIITKDVPVKHMSIENSFVSMKITFANFLAEICERVPGANIDTVTDAVGSDSRVGSRTLRGGTSYGGPCLPRDNIALSYIAQSCNVDSELIRVVDQYNRVLPKATVDRLIGPIRENTVVCVLGLAYKAETDILENSFGVAICNYMCELGAKVNTFGPQPYNYTRQFLHKNIKVYSVLEDAIAGAEIIILTLPDQAFLRLKSIIPRMQSTLRLIIDCWRILDWDPKEKTGIRYVALGTSQHEN
jgi:UDPglucose 6-dehydrogenase